MTTALVAVDPPSAAADVNSLSQLCLLHADSDLAAGVCAFGLGLLALPLLVLLAQLSSEAADSAASGAASRHSYAACGSASARRKPLLTRDELKRRFGELDTAALMKELAMSDAVLTQHIESADGLAIEEEVRKLQAWVQQFSASLCVLERRAALAFLSLVPEASEEEVNKAYKRMAFELHPDKGGCPAKFKELQEMRHRLQSHELQDDGEDVVPAPGAAEEQGSAEKEEKEQKKEELQQLRVSVHERLLKLWQRTRTTQSNLTATSQGAAMVARPLSLLQSMVQDFSAKELRLLKRNDVARAEAAFDKFVRKAADVIAVAAAADVQKTLALLALHFNYVLLAKCGISRKLRSMCNALLTAVAAVPASARGLISELEPSSGPRSRAPARLPCAPTAVRSEGSRKAKRGAGRFRFARKPKAKANEAKEAKSLAKPGESGLRCADASVTSLLVFEPPPMSVTVSSVVFVLKFRLAESRPGLELLRAVLEDKDTGEVIASMTGCYVMREGNDKELEALVRDAGEAPEKFRALAPLLFDDSKPSALQGCSAKARQGGLLFLEDLQVARHHPGAHGLELMKAVLRCLAGPMKRLTLVLAGSASGLPGLPWSRADQLWLLEVKDALTAKPTAKPEAKSEAKSEPKSEAKPTAAPRPKAVRGKASAAKPPLSSMPPPRFPAKRSWKHCEGPPLQAPVKRPRLMASAAEVLSEAPVPRRSLECLESSLLTARSRWSLTFAAINAAKTWREEAEQLQSGELHVEFWGNHYLPGPLRSSGVQKAFLKGMAEIAELAKALVLEGMLLTPETVTQATLLMDRFCPTINRHLVSHFFGRGGEAFIVLGALAEQAEAFIDTCESVPESLPAAASSWLGCYRALPMAMLDGDFDLLHSK